MLLSRAVEAETGEDCGGARGCTVGTDCNQSVMDRCQSFRNCPFKLTEESKPLRISFEDDLNQGFGAVRRILLDLAKSHPGGKPNFAPIDTKLTCNSFQQCRLARAVPADQADTTSSIDRKVCTVEQQASGDANTEVTNDQKAHVARFSPFR